MEKILEQQWFLLLLAALGSYLAGSVSFARIIRRIFAGKGKVKHIERDIPDTDLTLESDAVTATTVNLELGAKYGCLTSLLDMAKAAIPTGLFLYFFPGERYFLVAALFAMIGHIYPVYYRFRGGRGLSPLIGALLVFNWYGLLLSNLAAIVLAYLTGAVLVMRWAWMGLLIFWFAIFYDDPAYALYMVLANFLFFFSMRRELATAIKIGRNRKSTQEEVSEFMLMGKGLGRFLDKYGLPALLKKVFGKAR